MRTLPRILLLVFVAFSASACMWDAESLSREKSRSHDLARTIMGETSTLEDTNRLRARIKELESDRHETDPMWWNNLAGAHLRLNEPQVAVILLESVIGKFPDDYGIHANLGTAYHLLGRYQDAEKEIARDLEINPDAHFGLEKYHLALLQYLIRDQKYKSRHVFVDEFTVPFLINEGSQWGFEPSEAEMRERNAASEARNYGTLEAAEAAYQSTLKADTNRYEILEALAVVAVSDPPPAYRKNLNLRGDTNTEAGVIYMAQMNPKEPACQVMLGIAAWNKRNYRLASQAFERAIALGSPQSELLKEKVGDLQEFIRNSENNKHAMNFVAFTIFGLPVALIVLFIVRPLLRMVLKSRKVAG
jgi:tetratricopeptide (TPR) repeat protein